MVAGANGGDYSAKKLFVLFETDLCFREVLEIPLVGDLPTLVRGHIVNANTASCRAGVARFTA